MDKIFLTFYWKTPIRNSKRQAVIGGIINAVLIAAQIFVVGYVFGLGFHLAA